MTIGRTALAALFAATLAGVPGATGISRADPVPRPPADAAPDSGPGGASVAPGGPWFEVTVPGGTAALARAAGLDPSTEAWRLLPDLARRLHAPFGERTAARVGPHLAAFFARAGGPGTRAGSPAADGDGTSPVLTVPAGPAQDVTPAPIPPAAVTPASGSDMSVSDRVAIPLTPAAWDRILGRDAEGRTRDVLASIATDPRAARLYQGLATLDAPTLAALAVQPDVLRQIHRDHADAFSAFAASFRVAGGRVDVPGGHPEAALWQELVGASVMRPGDFLLRLASVDQGRLFLFYDAIDRLDDPHRRFALSAEQTDPARRQEAVRALKMAFATAVAWWDGWRLPFSRPVADAPRVLEVARVTDAGRLASPNRRLLWKAAFDDQVEASPDWREQLAQSPPADAAWLVEHITEVESNVGRSRLAMLAFAQRLLGDGQDEGDPADLLAALRGFGRYRALALALERMRIRDPALHAAAARHAEQIDRDEGGPGHVSLALFQGALALVERAYNADTLDTPAAATLVRSLVGTRLQDGQYGDRLGSWIAQSLVPALRARLRLESSASAESVILRAMAGRSGAPPARLDWEGLAYEIDPAAAEYRRLRAVRQRQGGSTLDEALAGAASDREPRLAAVLTDLAYAAALGPAEGAPAASEDVARRHDFGFQEAETAGGPRAGWMVPREVAGPGQRWHARGALLGLDLGLARLALRRLETDVPPVPLLSAADHRGFAESAVLVRAGALDDRSRDAIADALRRGRARIASAAADAAAFGRLAAEAGWRDWRRGALPWVAARAPASLESLFTLAEVLWLGSAGAAGAAAPPPSEWGTSARGDDGCLCPRIAPPARLDVLAGRTADGRLAALAPDVHLRVAELLSQMRLPARLAPAVLALAAQDLMDEAAPAYLDDRLAVSRFARALTRERMEDYVAALVGGGPLVPVAEP